MNAIEIVCTVLGSGVLIKLLDIIYERRKRKDQKEDNKDNTAEQIEELRTEHSEQMQQVNTRFITIEQKVDVISINVDKVMLSTKAQAYDRIRHLGLTYIKSGYISADELKNLTDMYESYKSIEDDKFLKRLMTEVNVLRIVPERSDGRE